MDDPDFAGRVGARIRSARTTRGISQSQLARQLPGATEGRDISRWERGANLPSWPNLHALAAALDITLAELVADEDPRRP